MSDALGDSEEGRGDEDSGVSSPLIGEDDDTPQANCGETTIELEIQRPNFYFVLDASGSMLETMPNSGGISRHLGARQAIGDMLRSVGPRINFGAATFPEQGGCSPGAEVYPVRRGEPWNADAGDGVALSGLLFTLRAQHPDGATPVSQTLRDLKPRLQELVGSTTVFLLTDGAPNCDLDQSCAPDRCIPNIEALELEDGRICGEEVDCCQKDLAPHLCLDDDGSEAAIEELASDDIKTYVIGIPGSETYAQILNGLAEAGNTAREGETAYYRVDDAEQLAVTLSDLGNELSLSCSFELGEKPKKAMSVGVFLDEKAIKLDDDDGFRWESESAILLTGEACARWKSGEIEQVRVLEGCPSVTR